MTSPEGILVRDLIGIYARADREGREADPSDSRAAMLLSEADITDLDLARLEAEREVRAARKVVALIEGWMATDIAAHGEIRLGDDGYYVGLGAETVVADPEGLFEWVRSVGGDAMVPKAFRLEPRLRVIQGLAADHDMEQQVLDTFFTKKVDGELRLRKTRAKWVEGLEHGERRPR